MEERKRIIIDAGHGGVEPGAIYMGRQEKNDTLNLALAVGQILEEKGVDVAYTRVSDVYHTPIEKAEIANRSGADYFVSIHRNAIAVPGSASGALSLVYSNSGVPALMAANIQKEMKEAGFKDLGVSERPGIYVLRRTKTPAVLVEAGFIDNEEDNRFFDQNFPQIAQAIAKGILTTIHQEESEQPVYYQIQVGAYQNRDLATQLETQLSSQGFPSWLKYEDGLFKVRVGAYLNLDNAARMEQTLRSYGYTTHMVKE